MYIVNVNVGHVCMSLKSLFLTPAVLKGVPQLTREKHLFIRVNTVSEQGIHVRATFSNNICERLFLFSVG